MPYFGRRGAELLRRDVVARQIIEANGTCTGFAVPPKAVVPHDHEIVPRRVVFGGPRNKIDEASVVTHVYSWQRFNEWRGDLLGILVARDSQSVGLFTFQIGPLNDEVDLIG